MEKMITVEHLTKRYGSLTAVDDISFYVERGKLFSFLGPNGAGKSTTIDILCTLLKKDGGTVQVNGCEVGRRDNAVRRSIGVVFQQSLLDDLLTVRENLMLRGALYHKKRSALRAAVEQAVQAAGAEEFLGQPYGRLSGGQRRRADVARALLHMPKVLFLDEPTTGLDPNTRQTMWQTVRRLQREHGMTVFLTTHYMEEAAASDYVMVMDKGRIVAKGTPARLKTAYAKDRLHLFGQTEALAQILRVRQRAFKRQGERLVVDLGTTLDALELLRVCAPHCTGFEVLQGTMDDAFLGIVGEGLQQ